MKKNGGQREEERVKNLGEFTSRPSDDPRNEKKIIKLDSHPWLVASRSSRICPRCPP